MRGEGGGGRVVGDAGAQKFEESDYGVEFCE